MTSHVLIIPSWYPKSSGDVHGSFFREQSLALKQAGCKVGVISVQILSLRRWRVVLSATRRVSIEDDQGVITYRKSVINWFPRAAGWMRAKWRTEGQALYDAYVLKHGRPDIIHVHSMLNGGVIAREIAQCYGIPYVVTEHSSAFTRGLISQRERVLASQIACGAARRFAVSSQFAGLMNKYLNQPSAPWEVMPNIVHDSFLLRKGAPCHDGFVFLNVCMLTQVKRVDLLLRAFAAAFRGQKSVKLRIGGDGGLRVGLEKLAAEGGVAEQVTFLGLLSRERVLEEMAQMDAFVLASEHETFGVVLIEALALGKPVIATRCGGPEDIVRDSDGLLVPTDDAKSLANAMQEMEKNHGAYQSQQIRTECGQRFGGRAVADRLLKVYEVVLGLASSPSKSVVGR